ncbi:MAG: complex I subunit 5 family protein [Clostridium sp.]|nr:complex I subunit 5 family protein [Clostridium sp.]MCM1399261.1 complex I subunit 5 family protein [Clostridium sp.]MCM1459749.1 complex I subunit 5 family protein [Bacteroides sp.]
MEYKLSGEFIIKYQMDELGVIFAILTSFMYLLIAIYQTGYFKADGHKRSYYVFYVLSYLSILSELFSANLITMYISFEFVSLTTAMFVFHERNKESRKGGFRILYFSIAGAFTALFGVFALYANKGGDIPFVKGGSLDLDFLNGNTRLYLISAFLMIIGFGVKAAILPYHAWLPAAHPVAPSPGSAALSGIIVKCGAFAVIRTVFYVFGADFIRGTWVQTVWMILAVITIFLGSMLAYREKIFKKRLAYSTVSQMNYIMFGLSLLNVTGFIGAMIHVVLHSMVKITLFLVAGTIIHQAGKRLVDEYDGLGRCMPVTFFCYTIASVTLVGIPPAGTFLSKWYLCRGALNLGGANHVIAVVGMVVLMVSALLTAGYLFPVFIRGYIPRAEFAKKEYEKCEPTAWMTVPIVILTVLIFVLGIYPNVVTDVFAEFAATVM